MELPESFYCPITLEIMRDPVIDNDGISYERSAIESWLQTNQISPVTRKPLFLNQLRPNRSLKESIEMITAHMGITVEKIEGSAVDVDDGVVGGEGVVCELDVVGDNNKLLIEIKMPEGNDRAPCDLCCVVDVSGSMGEEATLRNESGDIESHGLSLLDITKHAVKTIIYNLGDNDRLSLIVYSTNARVVFDLMNMNSGGRTRALNALEALSAGGQTNIWDGLSKGLDSLKTQSAPNRNASMLLFTDGLPNIVPPRGHVKMLQRYGERNGGLPCTINTFGFGYNLDSDLLNEIAIIGNGAYAFIPDSSLVGTVFVNALSNILSTMYTDAVLTVEAENGAILGSMTAHNRAKCSDTRIEINLGNLRYGQSRSIVIPDVEIPYGYSDYLTVTLDTNHILSGHNSQISTREYRREDDPRISVQWLRFRFIEAVSFAMKQSRDLQASQQIIEDLIAEFQSSPLLSDPYVADLFIDLEGQVREAFSREEYFEKWGKHYIPSLISAHLLQQCNNFKDPGVQHYGGEMFRSIRDSADETFMTIPPPKPTVKPEPILNEPSKVSRRHAQPSRTNISSMSAYYSNSVPCFDGSCVVKMADGSIKRVSELQKGDSVQTQNKKTAQLVCVVKTFCRDQKTELVSLEGGLLITPWHPIRVNGTWKFPANIKQPTIMDCPAVYSFLLNNGHTMFINDTECCTLAHGMKGDVIGHEYLGTSKITDDLKSMKGWSNGLIELNAGCLVRDSSTNLITSITQQQITLC
eukprot:TRINITY_DN450_c0_g3_i1.p1 TRINITY_DN450_c0_g3~~TRINITY_DN450_c0_g3_i1.p1  ORF type:complete len:751 (+),score=134.96 TRINITY_DN450_c0_g3_i1:233-2485(+)